MRGNLSFSWLQQVLCVVLFWVVLVGDAGACTSLVLRAENGDIIYGRTQEWGTFDIESRLVFYPRGYRYRSLLHSGEYGMAWRGRYGTVGIDGLRKGFLIDGMNEAGLTAGLLYHPGFATYEALSASNRQRALRPTDLLNYVLSTCGSVDDVRVSLSKVTVVDVAEEALGFAAPVHLVVTDFHGAQVIVEWLREGVRISDSSVGVLTNAPAYDWHLVNLRNYVQLSNRPHGSRTLAGVSFAPLGGGSGLLGLPGDFTPPSRFVRAVILKSLARKVPNGAEGIYEMFHILDNFNVPLGEAEGAGQKSTATLRSSTVWTVAHDQAARKMYYHTHNDRQVQMVDLNKIDFSSFSAMYALPLDTGQQSVKERTPRSFD